MSRPRLRALYASVVLVLLLAACGGDGDGDASVVDTSPTTAERGDDAATTTEDDDPTTTEADGDAAGLAEAVTLAAGDFTDEWTAEPSTPDGEDIRDCFTDFEEELVGDFAGDDFSREGTSTDSLSQVSSTGFVMTDADVASGFSDEFATDDFARCVEDQLRSSLGADLLDVALDPAPDAAPVGDQAGALNGTVTIAGDDGTPIDGEISVWLIRTEQVLTGVSVAVFGEPDTGADVATLADETTGVVARRQQAEVG